MRNSYTLNPELPMALILCVECGHRVSTRAAACPQCGCPIPSEIPPLAAPQVGASAVPHPPDRSPQKTQAALPLLLLVAVGSIVLIIFVIVPLVIFKLPLGQKDSSSDSPGPRQIEKAR